MAQGQPRIQSDSLTISSKYQTAIDTTDLAAAAWAIFKNEFESRDPSKFSIVRMRYEYYHMLAGQSIHSYLTTMREHRNQLYQMGEAIPDSTLAATILRHVNELWSL